MVDAADAVVTSTENIVNAIVHYTANYAKGERKQHLWKREKAASVKYYRPFGNVHIFKTCCGSDRSSQINCKAKTYNKKESCLLCENCGASDGIVAHTAGSGLYLVFKV